MGRVLVQQPGTNTAKALTETLPKNVIIVDEDLKELRLHDGVTPGGKLIGQSAGSGVPIGTIIPFAGNSVPQGYLLCDGSAISRTDYASLFAVIGTIYGAGDGNSTFNLPNFTDNKVPLGVASSTNVGRYNAGESPNITGEIYNTEQSAPLKYGNPRQVGALFLSRFISGTSNPGSAGSYEIGRGFAMDASRSSSVYKNVSRIISHGIMTFYLIKYI